MRIAFAILLFWTWPILAQGYIGIWNVPNPSESPNDCCSELIPFEPLTLYIVAYLDTVFDEGVRGAQFKIQNWPGSTYPDGLVTIITDAHTVNGDIDQDITLIFVETIPGPWALLASLQFVQFEPNWIGYDHKLTIAEGDDCDCLDIVGASLDGQTIRGYSAEGGAFLINPWALECSCEWSFVASTPLNWTLFKSLY